MWSCQLCLQDERHPLNCQNNCILCNCNIHYDVTLRSNLAKHFQFGCNMLNLSLEQCCLQTLIKSTYWFTLHCGGPVQGTWIGRDAHFLLSRYWWPQSAWSYNCWPFLKRPSFFMPVGFGRKVFFLYKEPSLFTSVCLAFSHLYWIDWHGKRYKKSIFVFFSS